MLIFIIYTVQSFLQLYFKSECLITVEKYMNLEECLIKLKK